LGTYQNQKCNGKDNKQTQAPHIALAAEMSLEPGNARERWLFDVIPRQPQAVALVVKPER
jgi:hypothetical protein